jgi:hypothetical protein
MTNDVAKKVVVNTKLIFLLLFEAQLSGHVCNLVVQEYPVIMLFVYWLVVGGVEVCSGIYELKLFLRHYQPISTSITI